MTEEPLWLCQLMRAAIAANNALDNALRATRNNPPPAFRGVVEKEVQRARANATRLSRVACKALRATPPEFHPNEELTELLFQMKVHGIPLPW